MNPPIRDWHGRRVWLVGASSGIGASLAGALAGRGAELALTARPTDRLERIAGETGGLALPGDVTVEGALNEVAAVLRERWGGVDHLVYLAAHYAPMRAFDMDLAAVRASVETNLLGAYAAVAAGLPLLEDRPNPSLVLVASVAGYRGLPTATAYGPTKAALINLAETLYLDLAPRGIGVHLVNPGFVRTPLTDRNDFEMPALIEPAEAAEAILDGLARGRFANAFPRRFTAWMRLLRHLPDRLYFPLVHKLTGL
ncbi:MAG: SDR family NAD(P)-dependent oxidoreductase [Gammaproteobacteria bacterium]|nr:SDR family NAD(P)-dependent oxidoreductase [Gammaproteobacteria bacterium]